MDLHQLAGYTIVREHGRGAMGTVYQALSPDRETVALKVLTWPGAADARARWEAIARFQREARAAQALSHPNICRVLDCGCERDTFFIVMEFLDGETIREVINQAGPIGPRRAAEIITSVAEGLAYAHEHGVIHRDIKPQNIMILRRSGEVKLTDFGLAAIAQERAGTRLGVGMGTPHYWSPEQERGEPADARSDIFSLGATLCEMLTGSPPIGGEIPEAVRDQWPDHVSRAVQKCLQREPRERFQSAREVIASLRDRPGETRPEVKPLPPDGRLRRFVRRLLSRGAAAVLAMGRLGRFLRRVVSRRTALVVGAAALLAAGAVTAFRPRAPLAFPEAKFPPDLRPIQQGLVATTIYTGTGKVAGLADLSEPVSLAAIGPAGAVPGGVYQARPGTSWRRADAYSSSDVSFAAPAGLARYPDGRVVVVDKGRSTVWTIHARGARPQVLTTEVPGACDVAIVPPAFHGPQVKPGDVLVCADGTAPEGRSGLYVIDMETRKVARLAGPPALPRGLVHARFGPEGTLYAVEDTAAGNTYAVATVTPEGRVSRTNYEVVWDPGPNTGPIAVNPKTGELYFAHNAAILRVPAGGGTPQDYAREVEEEITALEFTPDGSALLVGLWSDRGGGTIAKIAPYPIEGRLLISSSHEKKPPSAPQEFAYILAGNSASRGPVVLRAPPGMAAGACDLSPVASDLMVYITERDVPESWDKTSRIWTSDLAGRHPVMVGADAGINCWPVWSPDGHQIAFLHCDPISKEEVCQTGLDIWVMNADGTGARRVVRPTKKERLASQSFPDFSWWPKGDGFELKWQYGASGSLVNRSPDGNRTVFSRTKEGRQRGERGVWRQLCIGDPRGKNEQVRVQWFVKDSDIAAHLDRHGLSDPRDKDYARWVDDMREWVGPLKFTWSPSGRYVAFLASHPFHPEGRIYKYQLEVWVYELSTGILAKLTDDDDQESRLSWRPDPKRPDPARPGQ